MVNTKLLMIASALAMGLMGLVGTFLPHEFLASIDAPSSGALPAVVQVSGAALLGFAMANWSAKGALIGGIYSRPLALGNLMHFVAGAITLWKTVLAGPVMLPALAATATYTAFAVAFAIVLFGSPLPADSRRDS